MRTVTDTQIALNKGMKSSSIFMDLTSAFDTVWHDGLIYKLNSLDLPTTVDKMDYTFLNWATQVKAGEELYVRITIREHFKGLHYVLSCKPYMSMTHHPDQTTKHN